MKKIIWIVFGIFVSLISPILVHLYIKLIRTFIKIDASDLWSFSGAVLTAIIAGGFILYQLEYEKKHQEKEFKIQNRADIEFSFVRADISDDSAYLYAEDFYINNLKRNSKYSALEKAYFHDGLIPPTFKLECYNKVATKIEIYYEYISDSGKKYVQKIDAGNLSEGQSKYFITTKIMQHVCNYKNDIINKSRALVSDVEYFPDNILKNKIYITFRTLSYEKGLLIYEFDLTALKNNEDAKYNMIIEDILSQKYQVYYENDINFPTDLFDRHGKLICNKEVKKSRLVKLNNRVNNRI